MSVEIPGTEIASLCGSGGCPRVTVSADGLTAYVQGPVQQADGTFSATEVVVAVPVSLLRQAGVVLNAQA